MMWSNPFEPTLEQACQSAHLGWGAFFVAFSAAVGWGWLTGLLLTLVWCVGKEFIWDLRVERDSWGWPGSLKDATFYLIGSCLSAGLITFVLWWGNP